jgi:hypothetical protein
LKRLNPHFIGRKTPGMRQEIKNAFNKVFISISVDQGNRWVHTNWMGYLTEDNIKAGALAYTEAVAEAGFNCVLNDTSQVVGSWDHSLDWVVNQWAPAAARAGIRYFAIITNPESFAHITATNFYSQLKAFEVRVFDNQAAAEAWLRQYSLRLNTY